MSEALKVSFVGVRFEWKQRAKLERLAARTGRDMSAVLRDLVDQAIVPGVGDVDAGAVVAQASGKKGQAGS